MYALYSLTKCGVCVYIDIFLLLNLSILTIVIVKEFMVYHDIRLLQVGGFQSAL
jgi:hypothetical protein